MRITSETFFERTTKNEFIYCNTYYLFEFNTRRIRRVIDLLDWCTIILFRDNKLKTHTHKYVIRNNNYG